MRSSVKALREQGVWSVEFTEAQYDLLVRSMVTFLAIEKERFARVVTVGPRAEELDAIISGAERVHGGKAVIRTSLDDIHMIHSMLVFLPTLFTSEEDFVTRVGFFKENVAEVAAGLKRAIVRTAVDV
ncbi:hypothetical protein [Streptomyces sp. NPDC059575]|uniref:hypothetical protein n=1 Tax=Streptomyces sp. NPDC059575 TaxID=3346872 RepID=UPI0036B766BB